MSRAVEITNEISSYYPLLKQRSRLKEVYKDVIEEKFDRLGETRMIFGDTILHYRRRSNWKWKPEFYDFLEDEAKLPLAVSIDKKLEERFKTKIEDENGDLTETSIAHFRKKSKKYLGFYAIRATKLTKELQKEEEKELKDELKEKDLEELIPLYAENKKELDELENRYESQKRELLYTLSESGISSIECPIGTFRIAEKKPDYDISEFFSNPIFKDFSFTYKILNAKGDVECIDNFTNHTFYFTNETTYFGTTISLRKGKLWINDTRLKTDLRAIFEESGFYHAYGTVEVEPMVLFRHCSISSSKIEEMQDKALITSKIIAEYRYIEQESDLTSFFEIISKESENERNFFFYQKNARRGEAFRKKTESEINAEEDFYLKHKQEEPEVITEEDFYLKQKEIV